MTDLKVTNVKKRKLDSKINVDSLITNKDVITVQRKLLNELKDVPMDEEPSKVTISGDRYAAQLPTGDNDCWKSTPEGKTQHYDPMPIAAFDEDLSKNHAIQEWLLNHLPLKQEQKEKLVEDLSDDKKLNTLDSESSTLMTYKKQSKTKETYDKLKAEKKSKEAEGRRVSVKERTPQFTFSKTEVQCHRSQTSGDSNSTIVAHLVTPIKKQLETL